MLPYNPQVEAIAAASTTDVIIKADRRTDRHQIHVHFAAAAASALNIDGAAAPLAGSYPNQSVPEAANVPASAWVPLATAPTNTARFIVQGSFTHFRFDPGSGVGQDVTVSYQPLPPTSA